MSWSFKEVSRFIAGTVGMPGERQFFLQVRSGAVLICASLEKEQVSTFAQRLDLLTKQIQKQDHTKRATRKIVDDQPLEQPIENDFAIGTISIAWSDEEEKICIELFNRANFSPEDEESDSAEATFYIDIAQAQAFVQRSMSIINAGRLPCPFCSLPIDPQGHLCPRANGYRR